MQTHYEKLMTLSGPELELTDRLVRKLGLKGAFEALVGMAQEGKLKERSFELALSNLFIAGARAAFRDKPNPYLSSHVEEDPEYSGFIGFLGPQMGVMNLAAAISQSKHAAWYELSGKRTYEVSPGLAVKLGATELRGLKTDDLRLPYESLYLVIPPEAGLTVFNEETGEHPADGAYITEEKRADGRVWQIMVTSLSKVEENPYDDALHFFRVHLPEGMLLEDAIKHTMRIFEEEGAAKLNHFKLLERWPVFFRWVMNAMIYATWPDAEREDVMLNKEARQLWERLQKVPKGSPKRERLREEFKQLDPKRRIYLGRGVRPELDEHESAKGRPLEVRVRVQGHWKKQAHGEGRALRKTIWVQPYWRGPDDGALGSAVHRLV
jgi:hypothetical protein